MTGKPFTQQFIQYYSKEDNLRAEIENLHHVILKLKEEIQDLRTQLAKSHPWSGEAAPGTTRLGASTAVTPTSGT